jgi:hypothetical protein
MASGRCTAAVAIAGTLKVLCPCPRGEFEATLDVGCKKCAHPLSQHKDASPTIVGSTGDAGSTLVGSVSDASSTPVSGLFLPRQGMAPFISSLHFSLVFRSS